MASMQAALLDRFLRLMNLTNVSPGVAPKTVRDRLNTLCARVAGEVHGVDIEKLQVGDMAAEWIKPSKPDKDQLTRTSGPKRTILYLHGGGYVIGSIETHRATVARLALASQADALIVDYRLAPENPFPAAVEDAEIAYQWLLDQGVAPNEICVAGDSAGGGLSLALLMQLRDKRRPMPAAAVLLSPWTDLAFSGMSHLTHKSADPIIALEGAMLAARHYLGEANPTDPLASPLYGNFKGLPPLLIHVGSNEILLDDSTRVAEKARAAGVDVTFKLWPDLPHVFHGFQFLPEAQEATDEIGAYVRETVPAAAKMELLTQRSGANTWQGVISRLQRFFWQLPGKLGFLRPPSRTM